MYDDMIKTHFPDFSKQFGISLEKGSFPKVDIVDYDEDIVLIAEIPSMDKESLKVEVNDDVLTISGDKHSLEEDNATYLRRELKHSSFRRSFNLGDNLDSSKISASFLNGVLRIEIPKLEKSESISHIIDIN